MIHHKTKRREKREERERERERKMNAPAAHERFLLPEGVAKATYIKDSKLPNAATIQVRAEDHTAGHTIRCELLRNPSVRFAGYRLPHPLKYEMHLRVQTDGSVTPAVAVQEALGDLDNTLAALEVEVNSAVEKFKQTTGY